VIHSRRLFVQTAVGSAVSHAVPAGRADAKPLRGVFPIAQTPFTAADKLDVESLVEQLRFIHRGRVHGFVWPQLASEWSTLRGGPQIQSQS
jgi:hypothetical protein